MVRGLAGRPAIVDALVAGALVALGLVEAATTPLDRPAWLHALLTVVVMGAVAWRRRFPLAVLAFVVAGMMVIDADGQFAVFAALVIVSFTAGTELDPPRAWVGLALAVVPFCIAFAVTGGEVSDFVAVTVLYGGSWVVGQAVRDRTRRSLEAAERADRAERTREEDAARAVAAERARIARELHDVVAHSISVIAVQTQAVRRRLDPALGREIDDLRAVEVTARQAMAEMRRLFGVLRADGERPALAPQPGLDQLDRLVADTRAAGAPVDVVIEGQPVPLPPGVGLVAYRVVQEGLTNVRRHATGSRVTVCLRYRDAELDVEVVDTGGTGAGLSDGGGLGLVGMRERVALYGGVLEVGPQPGGGFAVRARLPFREGAAA
ncbi:sensor histidine kinase [Blastococcus capsensis]|uniref:sensor histidine kinase n=1 Tax=Blastococcus capsensis TaxID=1564163 RepID=UPI0025416487|nr:histidine kinase [Blastococcus capsensis]MDK3258112.1 histidine kinase [Blastococcus capsensis]